MNTKKILLTTILCASAITTFAQQEEIIECQCIICTDVLNTPVQTSQSKKQIHDNKCQQQCQTYNLPYGNFGLDCISNHINALKQKVANDTGISPFFNYYADAFTNVEGGRRHGANYTHLMEYGINVDMNKIAGVKGGSFTISGAYNAGKDLSGQIGNFYTISESSVTDGGMFYEMYYSQNIQLPWDDTINVSLGRMSMSNTFATLPVFGYLSSGSIDSTPESIFYASPYTSSTIATWGIAVEYQTSNNISFAYGLYQVVSNQQSSNWDGLDWGINGNDGYMMMAQIQWSPTLCGNLQGTYQFGGYFFDGFGMTELANPNSLRENGYGFYLQAQQMIWVDKTNPNKNITVWAGTQYAPIETISPIHWQVYAGIQFQGFVPHRENDSVFLSWTTGFFSDDYNNGNSTDETIFEVNYLWQVNKNISIQPTMQYVLNPNGDSRINDAVVLGGQLVVSF